jgi:hypothetical protein
MTRIAQRAFLDDAVRAFANAAGDAVEAEWRASLAKGAAQARAARVAAAPENAAHLPVDETGTGTGSALDIANLPPPALAGATAPRDLHAAAVAQDPTTIAHDAESESPA